MSSCARALNRIMKGYRILDNLRLAGLYPDPYIAFISSLLDTHNEADIYRIVFTKIKENGWK